jgi:hypothetical protein
MKAIEIHRNSEIICIAGLPSALALGINLARAVEDPFFRLNVNGAAPFVKGRSAELSWINQLEINDGDELKFKFCESDSATPVLEGPGVESSGYLEGPTENVTTTTKKLIEPKALERRFQDLAFEINLRNKSVVSCIDKRSEYISANILWNWTRTEKCNIFVASFSQQCLNSQVGSKKLFAETLTLGEEILIKVSNLKRAN